MIDRLKKRWGITSNTQIILILIVFSINGSFAAFIGDPLVKFTGIESVVSSSWLLWIIKFLMVLVVYNITLPIVGFCFGQFHFFWGFVKKMLKRIGFKRCFKD